MAIDSVSSSTNAQPTRPQVSTDQANAAEEARRAEQARQDENEKQAKQTEQPRPVVNTQGQTTGQVVNVTA